MISICISTYGEERWKELAEIRAWPSTLGQGACEVVRWHDPEGTVASARNEAARQADGDYLLFLDADDELSPGYVTAMKEAIAENQTWPCLFTPQVAYVRKGRRMPPKFWPSAPLHNFNWLVIGTVIEREFFFSLGGFKDYGDPPGSNAYEDWALWSRAERVGAFIIKVPGAVYIAYQELTSRHRVRGTISKEWQTEIGRDVWPEHYPPAATE